jgi:hypothetical protein
MGGRDQSERPGAISWNRWSQSPGALKPLIVDWKSLRKMGWCLSRAHTWRLMFDPDYADDAFPACRKLGKHRNSHPVWRVKDVLVYFEAHGLQVTEDWNAP